MLVSLMLWQFDIVWHWHCKPALHCSISENYRSSDDIIHIGQSSFNAHYCMHACSGRSDVTNTHLSHILSAHFTLLQPRPGRYQVNY